MTGNQFISLLESRQCDPRKGNNGWTAKCPAHEDKSPSLSISEGNEGRILVNCFAGCTPEAICQSLGITISGLFPAKEARNKPRLVKTYDYRDVTGILVFQVCRTEPKSFWQRRPDPNRNGDWINDLKGVNRVLYRLPEVTKANAEGQTIYITEGEKDADALVQLGVCATTNSGGAGKWEESYTEALTGADVVILPDKDAPGRKHAAIVRNALNSKANQVRVVELPDRNGVKVKDAFDWVTAGGTREELEQIVTDAPDWTAPEVETEKAQVGNKDASDIRGRILQILTDGNISPGAKRHQVANAVVDALAQRGQFYHHADLRDFDSAMFFDGERKRLERIRSDAFMAWLANWLQINRADAAFKFVQTAVETEALSGSRTKAILPEAYWAARPGAIYLSNGDGATVKITASDIQTLANGADGVLFAAGRTLNPWTLSNPVDPFGICSVFRNARCVAEHGLDLLRLWIISLPTNPRSKPPLCLAGGVGSGKSRLARGISELYGLPPLEVKVEENKESDFWPGMDQGGLLTLDNADTHCKWLADALAAASTDGCSQRRRLYTNSETVTLRARAWACITTANPTFASDAGLADRLLVIRMGRREETASNDLLSDEITAARNDGLTFICHTLQAALRDTMPTPSGLNLRHPDFAAFAVKIGRALGREAEAISALRNAEADKSAFCIENDDLGLAISTLLQNERHFSGTAADLLESLKRGDPDFLYKWNVKRIGKRLDKIWPHLVAQFKARKERCHGGIWEYEFRLSGGFGGFEAVF